MPIYEYHCNDCEKDFEKLVRSSEICKVSCPYCDSENSERKISIFGFSNKHQSNSNSTYCLPSGGWRI